MKSVKDILMPSFPEECGAIALDEELGLVAGGANKLAVRLVACTLALTSVGSGLFVESDVPFSKQSVSAIPFLPKKKYEVPKPWEVDEVIEAVRVSSYFRTNNEYNQMIKKLESKFDLLNSCDDRHLESQGKAPDNAAEDRSGTTSEQSSNEGGNNETVEYVNIGISGVSEAFKDSFDAAKSSIKRVSEERQAASLQYSQNEIKERLELAKKRKFIPLIEVEKLKKICNDEEKFKKAWKAKDGKMTVGEKWWKESISKNTYYVPCPSGSDSFVDGTIRFFGGSRENKVQSDEDLSVITTLQMAYWSEILKLNGFIGSKISLSYVDHLLRSREFCETVNKCFGKYKMQLAVNYGTSFSQITATQLMYEVAQAYAKQMIKTENAVFSSKMKRYAPLAAVAFLVSSYADFAKNISNLLGKAHGMARSALIKTYNRFIYNRLTLEKDPVKLRELISEYLKANIICQDRAIDRIVEIISGMADLWLESDKTGEGGDCACSMVFMGDSGIGKTYAARWLSKALFHKDMQPWQFVTSTAVTSSKTSQSSSDENSDKKSGKTEILSPADQLFNVNSEIVRQLRLNNRVVIVLDEVDKMHKSDPDGTITERLRDARDTGKLLVRDGVNYFYVDVSRTVFILITNERRECWGLPAVELTPEQAAARTYVERDKSLVNRFDVVEFDYFTSEGYQTVLRPQLEELAEEYKENYNININITDELVKSIGDAAERKNKGVRGINDYLIALRGKLVDYRSNHKASLTGENAVDLSVSYDQDNNSFELIDSKQSLINEKADDAPDDSDHGINLPGLIDEPIR